MKYIAAKNIIIPKKDPSRWFGINYNMNIYRGCSHNCIYCDSRSECYQINNFNEIVAKEDALLIIERELKSKRKTGIVGTGAMSDPYNPMERKHRLTKGALELINKYGFGINIITKSDLIVRDIDLLRKINIHSPVCIGITITAANDELSSKIEPDSPRSSERFLAIKELSDHRIYTGVLMMPILPFISDSEENIISIVRKGVECGAKFIYPWFGVTLRLGQREYFYNELDKEFPGIKERYKKSYGNSYECLSHNHKKLWELFIRECNNYRIDYKMSDIIKNYKQNVQIKQMSLF
ncbi:radical SAM protein [Tissierella sp. MSJ-40]|uniref:Radical SAM protein n=1 Tax=Tissierella simiarum TaxID=2841534 RepID=A0ABS6E7X4_9FIRM|nr:radical SAM protein [Tissierella simiarum]MBU5439021.1 radical SAM protein [Tissierella simiarum]